MEPIRINKYLAQCGICSRREADILIADGKVKINGETAQNGSKVASTDKVSVNGNIVTPEEKKVVLAYYKPIGVVVTQKDAHAKTTLADVIDYPVRLNYAGRLDKDSEGLLLLTNDGDLIHRMMKGGHFHEKEYEVWLNKEPAQEKINKLKEGIYLDDLGCSTRKCEIIPLGQNRVKMILTQGLNRQIRRMWKAVGLEVVRLKRHRVVNILLKDLKPGEYREISEQEKEDLYRLTKAERKDVTRGDEVCTKIKKFCL